MWPSFESAGVATDEATDLLLDLRVDRICVVRRVDRVR